MSTSDTAKAKQILDASAEIDAAKAEAEKLREWLALKEDILCNLQSANKSLEASLADKDQLLNAEKDAVVAVRKELERHIYEDTIVDGDILRKFRMPETFLRGGNFPFEFTHNSLCNFAATAGFPFTKDGENTRGLCLQKAANVLRELVDTSGKLLSS